MCVHPDLHRSHLIWLKCCFLSLQPSKDKSGSVLALHPASVWGWTWVDSSHGEHQAQQNCSTYSNSHQQLSLFIQLLLPCQAIHVSPQAMLDWVVFHPFSWINNWLWLHAEEITDTVCDTNQFCLNLSSKLKAHVFLHASFPSFLIYTQYHRFIFLAYTLFTSSMCCC